MGSDEADDDRTSVPLLCFEDFRVGQVFELGRYTMTQSEIIEFGERWMPQSFHTDPQAAAAGPFGGLIASGWHTTCVFMRLYYDGLLSRCASLGSPGVRELSWLHPVRPGDVLCARATVIESARSVRRPDRGRVTMVWECLRDEHVVLRMVGVALFASRTGSGGHSA